MGGTIDQLITWHEIGGQTPERPDADSEVMVYDEHLDDVVLAYLTVDEDGDDAWTESTSDNPLLDPKWWAEKPFPDAD